MLIFRLSRSDRVGNALRFKLFSERDQHLIGPRFDQRHEVLAERLHDVAILGGVAMSIVDRANRIIGMVEDAIHGLPTEAECGDGRATGPPAKSCGRTVLGSRALAADIAHRAIDAGERTTTKDKAFIVQLRQHRPSRSR